MTGAASSNPMTTHPFRGKTRFGDRGQAAMSRRPFFVFSAKIPVRVIDGTKNRGIQHPILASQRAEARISGSNAAPYGYARTPQSA